MFMNYYNEFMGKINNVLAEMVVTKGTEVIDQNQGMELWCEFTKTLKANNKNMYFTGNGASAAMAAHMSADASKNGEIKAQCFNESSFMTAIGNDIDYKEVFAYPLNRYANEGDVLVTISSSGNSPNIVRAIEVARDKKMTVVTLSGMKEENRSRGMGDLNFWIPSRSYGIVESSHQCLLHCWLDKYMELPIE